MWTSTMAHSISPVRFLLMQLSSEYVLANEIDLWAKFDVILPFILLYLPIWPLIYRYLLGRYGLHVQNHKQLAGQKGVGVREKIAVMVGSHESFYLSCRFHLPYVIFPF